MSDSPAKKLDFTSANKENSNVAIPIVGIPDLEIPSKPAADDKPTVAATIKEEESGEILLQENPQRFVLFPIQHHEVSSAQLSGALTRPTRR
jgi:ribonucleoside-diphosphate reductase subunit M2